MTDVSRVTCPWPQRWLHARQRRADEQFVYESLLERACIDAVARLGLSRLSDASGTAFVRDRLDRAWTLHKALPGQEHWRCACAPKG